MAGLVVPVHGSVCTDFAFPEVNTYFGSDKPFRKVDGEIRDRPAERVFYADVANCPKLKLDDGTRVGKVCIRTRTDNKTGKRCIRFNFFMKSDFKLIKSKVGITEDCSDLPSTGKYQKIKRTKRGENANMVDICFDEIATTESCCEQMKCAVVKAVVVTRDENNFVAKLDDRRCGYPGAQDPVGTCSMEIRCLNLIEYQEQTTELGVTMLGTVGSDYMQLTEDGFRTELNYMYSYEGRDVMIGTDNVELMLSYPDPEAKLPEEDFTEDNRKVVFGRGGNDIVNFLFTNQNPSKIYLQTGDDRAEGAYGKYNVFSGGKGYDILWNRPGEGINYYFEYIGPPPGGDEEDS
mmetsp:Transcript_16168/g.23457  ORF Transcript_16168/g.23457 Transcript_16168/m.23457 type:complete len:348 (-) Transcript_16168:422-1465(-)